MEDKKELMFNKAKFFFEQKIPVHINKNNGWFHNGEIKEMSADFLILIDEKEGEMPIFFSEIFEVSKKEERR